MESNAGPSCHETGGDTPVPEKHDYITAIFTTYTLPNFWGNFPNRID